MIQVDLITGFLGSGKTTFLKKYAQYLMNQGLKIGILEYDYGAVNVDMLLLEPLRGEQCEIEMVAAGCDVDSLNRRFKTKLIAMAMSGYDRVIVEPSGVFDMDLFFDTLHDAPLENWYEVGNIFTIISAKMKDDLSSEEKFYLASQAVCAGCILISRAQMASEDEVQQVKETIRGAAQHIRCRRFHENYLCQDWDTLTDADMKKLSSCGYQMCDYVKILGQEDVPFSSICFLEISYEAEEIARRAEELLSTDQYGEIIRIKGFAQSNGRDYELNMTHTEATMREASRAQKVLMIIGRNLKEKEIRSIFEKT